MTVKTTLDSLTKASEEQTYLVGVLNLWAVAKEAGHHSDDIATFTFRSEFLTPKQRAENNKANRFRKNSPYSDSMYHNCVRLTSGDLVSIPLTVRPIVPDHMKVSIKEVL